MWVRGHDARVRASTRASRRRHGGGPRAVRALGDARAVRPVFGLIDTRGKIVVRARHAARGSEAAADHHLDTFPNERAFVDDRGKSGSRSRGRRATSRRSARRVTPRRGAGMRPLLACAPSSWTRTASAISWTRATCSRRAKGSRARVAIAATAATRGHTRPEIEVTALGTDRAQRRHRAGAAHDFIASERTPFRWAGRDTRTRPQVRGYVDRAGETIWEGTR